MRQINCPKCGLPGSINDIMVGKNIQCSGCSTTFMVPTEFEETEADDSTRTAVQERHRSLEAGLLALPNLALRGTFTLALLYFLLVLVLITFSEFGVLSTEVALVIGVGVALFQFLLGPWILDLCLNWLYRFHWLQPEQLPRHLREFLTRVCAEQQMSVPSIGMIEDECTGRFYLWAPSKQRPCGH